MAIKKMTWEKGQALGIREKGEKLPDDLVLKYLDENMQNPEQLILKCGKSFWDVTNAPMLFDEGEDFDPSELTSIDKKQLSEKATAVPAFQDEPDNTEADRMNLLFRRTEDEEPEEADTLERKTYYFRSKDIEALTILCHETRVEMSAMAREIFERGIKSIADEFGYGDVYARAEANIANGLTGRKKSFKKALR